MPLPIDVQLSLLSRVLVFESSFSQRRPEDTVQIGIVYQSRFRRSRNAMDDLTTMMDRNETGPTLGLSLDYTLIEVGGSSGSIPAARLAEVDLLYVAPLRSFPLERVVSSSREADILSFTGVPEYVREGIAIGVDLVGERPRILVNLKAVKEEGAVLSSELLRLAEIIHDGR